MVPIFLEGVEGRGDYTVEEFQARFLEICAEHREDDRALAFAFLLYDFRNPQILKILRDSDYWRALDRLSGQYLTVFSFEIAEPRNDYRVERRNMVGVTGDFDPGMKAQLILRSYFGLEGRVRLPAVLFFQVHEGAVSNYDLWQIDSLRVEEAFLELQRALGIAVRAVEKIADENRGNSHEIFYLIRGRLSDERVKVTLKKGLKVLRGASEASSMVTMLL